MKKVVKNTCRYDKIDRSGNIKQYRLSAWKVSPGPDLERGKRRITPP
jgi:hypothetical protein